jgi:sugar lactone lactonase YvrE
MVFEMRLPAGRPGARVLRVAGLGVAVLALGCASDESAAPAADADPRCPPAPACPTTPAVHDAAVAPTPPDAANSQPEPDAANSQPEPDAALAPQTDAAGPPPEPDAAGPPPEPDAARCPDACTPVDAAVDAAGPPPEPDAAPPLPRAWAVRRLFTADDGLAAPDGLHRMADGRVLVANQVTGDVQVIDPAMDRVSTLIPAFPGLRKPEETADGPDGEIYVSDNASFSVYRIAPDGTHGVAVGPANGLVEPKGLAVGPEGTLYVADEGARRVLAFAPGAEAPVVLADPARGASSPESLQRAADGTLYVTDDHAGGVLRIAPDGAVDAFLTAAEVRWADAVSVAPDGDLWFSEANPDTGPRLLHYTPAGHLVETIAVPGPGRMLGVAALADGRVLSAFYQAPYVASEIWVAEPR